MDTQKRTSGRDIYCPANRIATSPKTKVFKETSALQHILLWIALFTCSTLGAFITVCMALHIRRMIHWCWIGFATGIRGTKDRKGRRRR